MFRTFSLLGNLRCATCRDRRTAWILCNKDDFPDPAAKQWSHWIHLRFNNKEVPTFFAISPVESFNKMWLKTKSSNFLRLNQSSNWSEAWLCTQIKHQRGFPLPPQVASPSTAFSVLVALKFSPMVHVEPQLELTRRRRPRWLPSPEWLWGWLQWRSACPRRTVFPSHLLRLWPRHFWSPKCTFPSAGGGAGAERDETSKARSESGSGEP